MTARSKNLAAPKDAMVIREDTVLKPGVYHLTNGLTIDSDGVTLDGNAAVLVGANREGRGICLEGRNDVTINRDRLPFGMTLDDYAKSQAAKLGSQLKGYEFIAHHTMELAGSPAHEFEFTWKTDDAGPVHQVLLSTAPSADGPNIVNLAATLGGRMTDRQLEEVRRILHSFQFNARADTAAGGAPSGPTA